MKGSFVRAFKGIFTKQNNTEREMFFCRIADIPSDFVASKINGTGSERKYPDGMELVFDLGVDNFRVFNHNTKIGDLEEISISDEYFNEE